MCGCGRVVWFGGLRVFAVSVGWCVDVVGRVLFFMENDENCDEK